MNDLESRQKKVLTHTRFLETIKILENLVSSIPAAVVLEVGATDASFKKHVNHRAWTTLDKFGNPDLKTDIDGETVRLPLESNSIDLAICTEVIEHLVMGTNLLKELGRVVTPKGRILISVPNIVSLKSRVKVLFGQLPISSASGDCSPEMRGQAFKIGDNWVGGHMMDFNSWRLKKYVERAGLKVEKHWPMPIELSLSNKRKIRLPSFMFSKRFSDFIVFELSPEK